MRLTALVLLLALSSCTAAQLRDKADFAEQIAGISDQIIGTIDPRFARVEDAVDGFQEGLEAVVPEDQEGPVTLAQWLAIIGSTVAGVFGVNLHRNSTRRKEVPDMIQKQGPSVKPGYTA